MINKEGELLICDFGISRQLKDRLIHAPHGKKSSEINRAHLVEYLAPEQQTGKPVYDIACDIYAAGILLHEMQTGSFPDLTIHDRTSTTTPEAAASEAGALPPSDELGPTSYDYIVKKSLSPKPWQRWESFIVMSYALEGRVQAKARAPEPSGSLMMPIREKLLRKRMIGFVLVSVLILGAIFGISKLVSVIPRDISGPREALTGYLAEDTGHERTGAAAPAKPKAPRPDPDVHFSYARDLIAKGELDGAEKEVQMALALTGDTTVGAELLKIIQKQRSIHSFLDRARRHVRDSELVEANVLLDQVLEMDPENLDVPDLKATIGRLQSIESLIKSARVAFGKKFYTTPEGESAYYFAKAALEEDPGNEDAEAIISDIVTTYTRIADAFFKAEEFSKAVFYYRKVLKIDGENAHALERVKLAIERREAAHAQAPETDVETPAENAEAEAEPAATSESPEETE